MSLSAGQRAAKAGLGTEPDYDDDDDDVADLTNDGA